MPANSVTDSSMRIWKSLGVPLLLFVVTAVAAWHTGDIARLGEGAATVQLLASRFLLSAVWLSAALVVIRSIQVFVWDRLAAQYLGFPCRASSATSSHASSCWSPARVFSGSSSSRTSRR